MDKYRIKGAAKQVRGWIKDAACHRGDVELVGLTAGLAKARRRWASARRGQAEPAAKPVPTGTGAAQQTIEKDRTARARQQKATRR